MTIACVTYGIALKTAKVERSDLGILVAQEVSIWQIRPWFRQQPLRPRQGIVLSL